MTEWFELEIDERGVSHEFSHGEGSLAWALAADNGYFRGRMLAKLPLWDRGHISFIGVEEDRWEVHVFQFYYYRRVKMRLFMDKIKEVSPDRFCGNSPKGHHKLAKEHLRTFHYITWIVFRRRECSGSPPRTFSYLRLHTLPLWLIFLASNRGCFRMPHHMQHLGKLTVFTRGNLGSVEKLPWWRLVATSSSTNSSL